MQKVNAHRTHSPGDETWQGNFINPSLVQAIHDDTSVLGKTYNGTVMATYKCNICNSPDNTLTVIWRITYGAPRILAYETDYANNLCEKVGINSTDRIERITAIQELTDEQTRALTS